MSPTSPEILAGRLGLIAGEGFAGYELIDSGKGRKLERFGTIVVDRPEPQALWMPRAPDLWARAHAVFSSAADDDDKGRWRQAAPVPQSWPVTVDGATLLCRLGNNWHLGLFPEQMPHWRWMSDGIGAAKAQGRRARVLNLFAYTGAASLIAAGLGAEVTHVDASKKAVAWARENQAASDLAAAAIRWIVDDARKFTAREVRRGRAYDIILADPPKFGRGPDHEVWELFEHLPALLADLALLLAPGPSRLVLTAYAIRASALSLDGVMRERLGDRAGRIESGELAIVERGGRVMIGTSLYSRFEGAATP